MSAKKKRGYLLLVLSATFLSVLWMLSIHNAFVFDDWALLSRSSLLSYDQLFSLYPSQVYLDRPVRDIVDKLLYDLFGDDYALHHVALVFTHLLNTLLAFLVARRVFAFKLDRDSDQCYMGAIIAAGVFGAWPNSSMAVQWISASNDLMGTTFALLSFLFYLRSRQESQYCGQNTLLLLFFYFLSIRTKEMFYPLPLVFVLCEIYTMILEGKQSRLSTGCMLSIAIMIVFLAGIFYYKAKDSTLTVSSTEPYYQSFSPLSMIVVLAKYCMLYFDLLHGGFSFEPSASGAVGLVITLVGLLAAIILAFKRKPSLLFCYVSIGISIVMVLPMVNQIHRLYLYMPAFFVGITVACAACALPQYQEKLSIFICLCCVLAGNAEGPQTLRSYWYDIGDMENDAYNQLAEIEKPVPESHVYILLDDTTAYTPFYYGQGSIVKFAYQDNTLLPSLHSLNETIEYEYPYVVLKYSGGKIEEVARDEHRVLDIASVYPSVQKDGSLVLGVVPKEMRSVLEILVDGEVVDTIRGKDFVSATVDRCLLEGKSSVQIVLRDEYGTVSDPCEISLYLEE